MTDLLDVTQCVHRGSGGSCTNSKREGWKCFVKAQETCTINDSHTYTIRVNDMPVQLGEKVRKPNKKAKPAPPPPTNTAPKAPPPPPAP